MSATTRLKPRVFVFERYDPTEKSLEWLIDNGIDLTLGYPMWETPFWRYTEDQIIEMGQGHVALMGGSVPITRRIIQNLPDLKYICKFGIGVDSIDLAAAKERDIRVSNTPEDSQATTVCEHTLAMLFAFWKRLHMWTPQAIRKGEWRGADYAKSIGGSTVGLIGLGRIGRGVAQRLANWDVSVIAYDPLVHDAPPNVKMVDLETLLRTSDAVSLHATPGPDNLHLIDATALSKMKPTSVLVNTGRGSLVDYNALKAALREKRIAGAALDVFEEEPPSPDDELFKFENVFCTPHVASWTTETAVKIGWRGARNILAMIRGEIGYDVVI